MNDLGLELFPKSMALASNPQPVELHFVRELREEDLGLLLNRTTSAEASNGGHIKRLSDRHHAAARLIARGLTNGQVAATVGYSEARVASMKSGDPAFKELVNFYRDAGEQELRSNFERLAGLTADAADELSTRLEEAPEKVSTPQLLEIVKLGADRTGLGPQSSSVQVNINADLASKMKAARERAMAAARQIEGPPDA